MKVLPWHDKDSNFYHDNSDCDKAKKVPLEQRNLGKGGKQRCRKCHKLSLRPEDRRLGEDEGVIKR